MRIDNINQVAKLGPHPDCHENLRFATSFVNKIATDLIGNLKVAIKDSQQLPRSIVVISDKGSFGRWANPVCVHKNHLEFKKELTSTFDFYLQRATREIGLNQIELALKC